MKTHWIAVIKWNDGTILRTEPFYEYDEGIKTWSSKFSYENKGKFEWIDYEKVEEPKEKTLEEVSLTVDKIDGIIFDLSIEDKVKLFDLIEIYVKEEQDKNKYCEELKQMFDRYNEFISHHEPEEWRPWIDKQFKNKETLKEVVERLYPYIEGEEILNVQNAKGREDFIAGIKWLKKIVLNL